MKALWSMCKLSWSRTNKIWCRWALPMFYEPSRVPQGLFTFHCTSPQHLHDRACLCIKYGLVSGYRA